MGLSEAPNGAASYSLGREPQGLRRETATLFPEPPGRPVGPAGGLREGESAGISSARLFVLGLTPPGYTMPPRSGLRKPRIARSNPRMSFPPCNSATSKSASEGGFTLDVRNLAALALRVSIL